MSLFPEFSEADDEPPSAAPEPEEGNEPAKLKVQDAVRFEVDDEVYEGVILSINGEGNTIIGVPPGEDVAFLPINQLAKVTREELERWEQWCLEVRDPAREHTEGIRAIVTGRQGARIEYEIAQIAAEIWAVCWMARYHCGDHSGFAEPWQTHTTRTECLQIMLKSTREFFSVEHEDALQTRMRNEMLQELDDGLFGFIEPNPYHSHDY
ncbi:MAG: hypothetical protein R3C18_16140 [Planctomycetaceae bacterium]